MGRMLRMKLKMTERRKNYQGNERPVIVERRVIVDDKNQIVGDGVVRNPGGKMARHVPSVKGNK